MALEATKTGLVARLGEYEPLRAFSQGGRYWDRVAQQLVRESSLAEFLPPVELEEDEHGKYARFHWEENGQEWLGRSVPVGSRGLPPEQLQRLQQAVEQFRKQVDSPAVQVQNRELIERFQLPDWTRHPELYRLAGPWWNRRLKILWGCERTRECSLPAQGAVRKITADKSYHLKRWLPALLLLLALLLIGWFASHWYRSASSQATGPGSQPLSAVGREQESRQNQGKEAANRPAETGSARTAADAKARAEEAARAAKQAQAEADKARARAQRAQKEANATQAEDARKRRQVADAEAAAAKAEAAANKARAEADKAKADALAAEEAARRSAPADPGGKASKEKPPRAPAEVLPADSSNSVPAGTDAAPAVPPSAAFRIVLSEQGQPAVDGTMEVALQVCRAADPNHSIPVDQWTWDGQTVKSKDELRARMKGGEHVVKAVVREADGQRREVLAVVTVEPGRVIATGGKVSVQPRQK